MSLGGHSAAAQTVSDLDKSRHIRWNSFSKYVTHINKDDKMNMSLLFFSLANSMRQYYTIHHSMSHNATDMPAKISSIQTNDDVLDAVKNLCNDCQKWDKVHAATCEEFTEEQQKALKQMVQMIVICSKEIEELALYPHEGAGYDVVEEEEEEGLGRCLIEPILFEKTLWMHFFFKSYIALALSLSLATRRLNNNSLVYLHLSLPHHNVSIRIP